jgi:uncharacterized membrane protein
MGCTKPNFDYTIKKNDTKPFIKYLIEKCEDIDLSEENLIITASMWADSTLKNKLTNIDEYLELKNNYNLEAVKQGDYILIKKFNTSEHVIVSSIEETKINIQRAQLDSTAQNWIKGNEIKIIKFYEVEAEKEIEYNTSLNVKGEEETLPSSQNLIYKWQEGDTSSSGVFFLEFKVSKVDGEETLWIKKIPSHKEGISIKITNDSLEI